MKQGTGITVGHITRKLNASCSQKHFKNAAESA